MQRQPNYQQQSEKWQEHSLNAMPGLESQCTKVFLSHLMGKRQLGSSCCISCLVGAGGCIDSGIKRTFRALHGCGLKEAKSKNFGPSLSALPCQAGEGVQPVCYLPWSCWGKLQHWGRWWKERAGKKRLATAQMGNMCQGQPARSC